MKANCPHGLKYADECAFCKKLKIKREDKGIAFDTVREMELNQEHFLRPKRGGFVYSESISAAAKGLGGEE